MMRSAAVVLAFALLAAGCPPPPDVPDAGDVQDAGDAADAGEPVDAGSETDAGVLLDAGPIEEDGFLATLDEVDDVATLANDDGAVKMLLPVAGAPPRAPLFATCAFQDTQQFPFHVQFLQSLPGGEDIGIDEYVSLVLKRASRAWWGGEVELDADRVHPITGESGTLLFALYTEDSAGNRLVIDDVRAVHAALVVCAPAFAQALAFVPTSNEQRQTAQLVRDQLAAEGIAVVITP